MTPATPATPAHPLDKIPDDLANPEFIESQWQQERKWTVDWNILTRGSLYKDEPGAELQLGAQTAKEYSNDTVFPSGVDVRNVPYFTGCVAYVRFMWNRTKVHKGCLNHNVLFLLILVNMLPAALTHVLGTMVAHVNSAKIFGWEFVLFFAISLLQGFVFLRYEAEVPLASQRYGLRCTLLTTRMSIDEDHSLAKKWPPGRFAVLLMSLSGLVNGIWGSFLDLIGLIVKFVSLIVVVTINVVNDTTSGYATAYLICVMLLFMILPFFWKLCYFRGSMLKAQERTLQAQRDYVSLTVDTLTRDATSTLTEEDRLALITRTQKGFMLYRKADFRNYFVTTIYKFNYRSIVQAIGLLGFLGYYGIRDAAGDSGLSIATSTVIVTAIVQIIGESVQLCKLLYQLPIGYVLLQDVAEILNYSSEKENTTPEEENLKAASV